MQLKQKINEEITAPEIRVISDTGEQLGIISLEDALKIANEHELDLVEVAPKSAPPVCRIMNFGKFKYEQQKKEHQAKRKSHNVELKELRLGKSVNIEKHDLDFKLKKGREFLEKGHRLQVFMQLRGREISHAELGVQIVLNFVTELLDIAKLEQEPRKLGRRIIALLAPLPNVGKAKEKKLKQVEKQQDEKDVVKAENTEETVAAKKIQSDS